MTHQLLLGKSLEQWMPRQMVDHPLMQVLDVSDCVDQALKCHNEISEPNQPKIPSELTPSRST